MICHISGEYFSLTVWVLPTLLPHFSWPFSLIHLSWKKVKRHWSFCLIFLPTPLLWKECGYSEETVARSVSSPLGQQKRTDTWTYDQFRLSSTSLLDWSWCLRTDLILFYVQKLFANTPVKHQYISIKPSYCKCHPIRYQWPHNRKTPGWLVEMKLLWISQTKVMRAMGYS